MMNRPPGRALGASRPNFYGLGLGFGTYGLDLDLKGQGLAYETCTDNVSGSLPILSGLSDVLRSLMSVPVVYH